MLAADPVKAPGAGGGCNRGVGGEIKLAHLAHVHGTSCLLFALAGTVFGNAGLHAGWYIG